MVISNQIGEAGCVSRIS